MVCRRRRIGSLLMGWAPRGRWSTRSTRRGQAALMKYLLSRDRTGMARMSRERGLLSGPDLRQAVMAVANMLEALLNADVAGEAVAEDHVVASEPVGDRVRTSVDPGAGAGEHRVHDPAVRVDRDRRRARLAGRAGRRDRRRPGHLRAVRFRTRWLPRHRGADLHGRGRRRIWVGGVSVRPFERRPDPADGAGPAHRHPADRRRRRLRPGQRQRPVAARPQRSDE